MSRTIWKFDVALGVCERMVPAGHKFRRVGLQFDSIMVWAEVEPETPVMPVRFATVGTGHPIPDWAFHYVGSVDQGPFVWHVFADTNMTGVFADG